MQRPEWRIIGVDNPGVRRDLRAIGGLMEEERIRFLRCDILNEAQLKRVFWSERPDFVINLMEDPADRLGSDLIGPRNLFQQAIDVRARRFLHISPATVAQVDSSPVVASRAAGEIILRGMANSQAYTELGLLRVARVFGQFERPGAFIPATILSHLNRTAEPPASGVEQDWLSVEELSRALVSLIELPRLNKSWQALDVAGYTPMTEIQVAAMIGALIGKSTRASLDTVKGPLLDPAALENLTGFRVQGSMRAALDPVVRWYVRNRWWWERQARELEMADLAANM